MAVQDNHRVWDSDKYGFLSQRKQSILNGTCPDATDKEIKYLRIEMKRRRHPEFVKILDELYPDAVFKECKALVRNAGFDPKEHTYERDRYVMKIDGLTVAQWKYVYDPTYEPTSMSTLSSIIGSLKREGKHDLAEHVEEKYAAYREKCLNRVLVSNGIVPEIHEDPINYKYGRIDGISFGLWKALNEPEYVPQLSHLKSWIKKFEAQGEDDKAIFLMDKYENLLCKDEPEPELSLEEAEDYFKDLLGPNYSRK